MIVQTTNKDAVLKARLGVQKGQQPTGRSIMDMALIER